MGGTNIVSGVVDHEGNILTEIRKTTEAILGVGKVVGRIVASIKEVMESANITIACVKGIGIGSPGPLDSEKGIIVAPPNLFGWENVPLRDILEKEFKVPVFIGHDAAMVTLGEKYYGAGMGVDNLVCATLGTGIGMGIIIDGRLYERSTGDFGHMIMDRNGPRCNCGGYGCLERLVSGPQIAAKAIEKVKWGAKTLISSMVKGDLNAIEAKTVFESARQGDETALEIVEEIGEILGRGITNVFSLLNPELFILGGMIARAGDILFDPVRKVVAERGYFEGAEEKIVPAKLGDEGGIKGVAHLVREKLSQDNS